MSAVEHVVHHALPAVQLTHAASRSRVVVLLHGATVVSWCDAHGVDALFVSTKESYEPPKAVRGGIPLCWPQFASSGPLRHHGFVRNALWTLAEHAVSADDGSVSAKFTLTDNESTRAEWPHRFALAYTVTVGADFMRVRFEASNTDAHEWSFTNVLHTYFAVKSLEETRVGGLQGTAIFDKVRGVERSWDDEFVAIASEVDQIHKRTALHHELRGSTVGTLAFDKTASLFDTVVWNPHTDRTPSFKDLGELDYQRFVCVEAGCVSEPVPVAPGATWSGECTYRIA